MDFFCLQAPLKNSPASSCFLVLVRASLVPCQSPFDAGLFAHSDKVTHGSSPTVGVPAMAFDPHNNATMITVPDNPNGCFGTLNNCSGSSLPLLASGTMDTRDANVPFMTWVPPQCAHLFLGCHLDPRASAVASVTTAENDSVHAQAQPFVDWLMALTHP